MRADVHSGSCKEVVASRARILTAADETRRQLERELRERIEQRLLSLGFELRWVEESVPPELDSVKQQLSQIMSRIAETSHELMDICRAIHPAIVSVAGLQPALDSLCRRCPVPVTVDLAVDRELGGSVELATYYVVAEALGNTVKHGQASRIDVSVRADDDTVDVLIADNGVGGADPRRGSGLMGLKDRVEALGGTIRLVSPRGGGTSVHAAMPIDNS